MLTFELYDGRGSLVFVGYNWPYARAYLEYMAQACWLPPRLVVRDELVFLLDLPDDSDDGFVNEPAKENWDSDY